MRSYDAPFVYFTRPYSRAEDRIRAALTTGPRNLPLHDTAQRVWLEIVQIALALQAWIPILALNGKTRLWGPRRLRLRLFSPAGQLVTTGRRHVTDTLERLDQLPNPV